MKFGYEAYTYIYLTHSLLYPPFGGVLFYIGDDFMISTSIHRVNFYDTDAMAVVHHSTYVGLKLAVLISYVKSVSHLAK